MEKVVERQTEWKKLVSCRAQAALKRRIETRKSFELLLRGCPGGSPPSHANVNFAAACSIRACVLMCRMASGIVAL